MQHISGLRHLIFEFLHQRVRHTHNYNHTFGHTKIWHTKLYTKNRHIQTL